MSIRICGLCKRYGSCEHPEKGLDVVVPSCHLFRDADTGDRVCLNCVKFKGNGAGGTCSGTREYVQYCRSYEPTHGHRGIPQGRVDCGVPNMVKGPAEWPRHIGRDRLDLLFAEQAKLNKRAGFDVEEVFSEPGKIDLLFAGHWTNAFATAMQSELCELRDCTYWKHWYAEAREGRQYEISDLEHAKVEVIDLLFFWISLCQTLGMGPEDVYRIYHAKLAKNHARQDDDCTSEQAKGYDI